LNIKIDTTDIQKKMEHLRIQRRNLMDETIRSLQKQKVDNKPTRVPQIYR
jgi:hypothetical protein